MNTKKMNKMEMLADISNFIHEPLYDELDPYMQGVRDMINFIDGSIANVDEKVIYEHIKNAYKRQFKKLKTKQATIHINMYESEYKDYEKALDNFLESFSSLDVVVDEVDEKEV